MKASTGVGRVLGRMIVAVSLGIGVAGAGAGGTGAAADSQRALPYPDDPAARRDWLDQQIAACDGAEGAGAIGVCTNLIDSPWFAGALLGRLYARRGQAYLSLGDEQRALKDFDYGLQFYDQNDPLPGGQLIRADPAYRLPGPDLADNTQLRASTLCGRAEIRWRAGDTAGAGADFRSAQALAPDAACAASGLGALAGGAPPPDLAEAGRRTQDRLRRAVLQACAAERMSATRELFGAQAGEDQAALLDDGFGRMGVFTAGLDDLVRDRALHGEGRADRSGAAAGETYLVCLQTARIRQLDPGFDLSQPIDPDGSHGAAQDAPPQDDVFAGLPRRDAGAATGLLSESLDPNARRQRQARVVEDTRRREANVQARAANRAAFWSALGDVLVVGAQVYVATETARLQMEAAQAASTTYVPTPSAATVGQVAAVVAPRDQGFAMTLPPADGGQGYASTGRDDTPEPMGQRIYDTAQQYAASRGQFDPPSGASTAQVQDYPQPDATRCLVPVEPDGAFRTAFYVAFRNGCREDVHIQICIFSLSQGRWSCGASRTAPGAVMQYHSMNSNGRYGYAACTPERMRGRYRNGNCGGNPNNQNASLVGLN